MNDKYYSDNRDLIKWAGVLKLCSNAKPPITKVFYIAYQTESSVDKYEVIIDGKVISLPQDVIKHFRTIEKIKDLSKTIKIEIYSELYSIKYNMAKEYHEKICKLIKKYSNEKLLVLFDPDTGLIPPSGRANDSHVSLENVKKVWCQLKKGDVFLFYQHSARFQNKNKWLPVAQDQLTKFIPKIKIIEGPEISNDVVLFFAVKQRNF